MFYERYRRLSASAKEDWNRTGYLAETGVSFVPVALQSRICDSTDDVKVPCLIGGPDIDIMMRVKHLSIIDRSIALSLLVQAIIHSESGPSLSLSVH
jgi:hypothetical protein